MAPQNDLITHLACIMDGNRRWAQLKGLQPWYGHKEGIEAALRVVDFCIERNIGHLSLFTFALQNFKRPLQEIQYLFDMLTTSAHHFINAFVERGVQVEWIGNLKLFPQEIQEICKQSQEHTAQKKKLKLQLYFGYDGQEEIIAATAAVAQQVCQGLLKTEEITPALFKKYLWGGAVPDPDLIIRTGGMQRLSGFMLYQAAYSEFYFLDCLWPEISQDHLQKALDYFNNCQRNFGI